MCGRLSISCADVTLSNGALDGKGESPIMEWKLEVVTIPVSDLDRSRDFYAEKVGFNIDIDHTVNDFRFL